jgi:hypothetical protein
VLLLPKRDGPPTDEVVTEGAAPKAVPPLAPADAIIEGLLEPYSMVLSEGEFIAMGDALRDPGSGVPRLAEDAWGVPAVSLLAGAPNLKTLAEADAEAEAEVEEPPKVNVAVGAGGGSVVVGAFAPRPLLSDFDEAPLATFDAPNVKVGASAAL